MKRALLILILCAGVLATGLAGGQRKTPLEVCLDGGRDWAARADACRTAAEQEHPKAQYYLGAMYENGQGVPQDYAEAVRWYRRAAEQGDADAQNNLGGRYYNGQGVPQDYAEAMRWYRQAAEQGLAAAQSNLGVMYDNGLGVPADYVRAHMWYNLAAANGSTKAPKNRDLITRLMTPQQIAEAQRMASEWFEKRKGK